MNRRQFLKQTAQVSTAIAGSSLLSSCATVDRVFSVEKTEFDQEVIIIGGGAAGLMAALTCKKRKIPYRLFEASHRMGGRVRTAQNKIGTNITALDLGVDTVDERHRQVFELCRELNLELSEKSSSIRWQDGLLWSNDKFISVQKQKGELEKVFSRLAETQFRVMGERKDQEWETEVFLRPEVQALDKVSFGSFITEKKIKLSAPVEEFLQGWCLSQWGLKMDQVSVFAVILFLDPENRGPAQYQLRNGFGSLTQTMFQRSAGVISNHLVKTGYQLTEVEEKQGRYHCNFQYRTLENSQNSVLKKIECTRLILALPITQISKINWDGDLNNSMASWKKNQFGGLAAQVKSFHNGSNRQLKNKWAVSQNKIYRVEPNEQESHIAVLSAPGAITPEGEGFPKALGYTAEPITTLDWTAQKWIQGSRWTQGLGVLTGYQQWKKDFKSGGRIYFSGEFDSTTYPGTLEAALASGVAAVTAVAPEVVLQPV